MDVNKMLQFVDKLVLEQTGQHLNDVQKAVVEGTWNRQTYDDIAKNCHVTKNHVADLGCELWNILSTALDEDIKKSNFRSNLERVYIEKSQNICIGTNHNFTFGSQILNSSESNLTENNIKDQQKNFHMNLTLAPKIINFYDRKEEIKFIESWIFEQNIRLISILGFSGIGKSTLVKNFIDSHLKKFEVIIWKKSSDPKPLNLLIDDVLKDLHPQFEAKGSIDDKLKELFNIFREHKCLIVLDDIHNIFAERQFSGHYQTAYQSYQTFFTLIAETEHQSHVILISREKCSEMDYVDDELYSIRFLELMGLRSTSFFKKPLVNQDLCLQLIDLHEGNPFYLKEISLLIKDVFDNQIEEFFSGVMNEHTLPIITNTMRSYLEQLLNRLAPIEQIIVAQCSKFDRPLTHAYLLQSLDISSLEFMNGLQSLKRRYIIRKIVNSDNEILLQVSPVLQQYIKKYMPFEHNL